MAEHTLGVDSHSGNTPSTVGKCEIRNAEGDLLHTHDGSDLRNAFLAKAYLRGAQLRGQDLSGANLADADLRDSDLSEAMMVKANLTDACFAGANLGRGTFVAQR